MQRQESDFEL